MTTSSYLSHPDVPPYRPRTYPKRRKAWQPVIALSPVPEDFTYTHFLHLAPIPVPALPRSAEADAATNTPRSEFAYVREG